MTAFALRPFAPADLEAVVGVWHRAMRDAYTFLGPEHHHTLDEDRAYFRDQIVPRCAVTVCTEDEEIRGFIAVTAGGLIDRLYVDPAHQRRGVGTLLLDHAARTTGTPLRLFTHQRNWPARAFYERHGFRAVAFGTSPPPESEPDVEYVLRRAD